LFCGLTKQVACVQRKAFSKTSQLSIVHWSWSSQSRGWPVHAPLEHVSSTVHGLLSSHDPPCGTGGEQVPVPGLQVPGSLH
jgi:hypothetical protein